mgnify:CR=1 FL=1
MRKAQLGFGIIIKNGTMVEANMQSVPEYIEGSGIESFSCYPACLVSHDIGREVAGIYMLHDVQMRVFPIRINQIVRYTLPLPSEQFAIGDNVEIQYRVGVTDEYGWWSATVTAFDPISSKYLIQWHNSNATEWVNKVRVRKAAFV